MSSENAVSWKKKPALRQGQCIGRIEDLAYVLETQPSIWWRHRANSCAFFLGWPLRQILNELDGGNFFMVERKGKGA